MDGESPRVGRLLITGTREGWPLDDLNRRLAATWTSMCAQFDEVILVHGAAPGVDQQAADIWQAHRLVDEPHPAKWATLGRAAGPARNTEMVALGADRCIAFPIASSKGTIDCLLKAAAAGIPTEVFGRPS